MLWVQCVLQNSVSGHSERKEICLFYFLTRLRIISVLRVDGEAAVLGNKHLPSMKEALTLSRAAWRRGQGGGRVFIWCTRGFSLTIAHLL